MARSALLPRRRRTRLGGLEGSRAMRSQKVCMRRRESGLVIEYTNMYAWVSLHHTRSKKYSVGKR